jgi:hypothetical protein
MEVGVMKTKDNIDKLIREAEVQLKIFRSKQEGEGDAILRELLSIKKEELNKIYISGDVSESERVKERVLKGKF